MIQNNNFIVAGIYWDYNTSGICFFSCLKVTNSILTDSNK